MKQLNQITIALIKELWKMKYGKETIDKFNIFLKKKRIYKYFYRTIVKMYNELGHGHTFNGSEPIERFNADVMCSSKYELSSCFINWDNTSYSREDWEEFNKVWQETIK